ncbi:hypothetical protein MHBO_003928, partial [Bonamia ostreae]
CLPVSCDGSAATNSHEYSTVLCDGFTRVAPGTSPLRRELDALSELVECVRVDLLQTS